MVQFYGRKTEKLFIVCEVHHVALSIELMSIKLELRHEDAMDFYPTMMASQQLKTRHIKKYYKLKMKDLAGNYLTRKVFREEQRRKGIWKKIFLFILHNVTLR